MLPFEYDILSGQSQQIRLLKPVWVSDRDTHLSLETFTVQDCPVYQAFSFTWDPKTRPRTDACMIVVNERTFEVRENLYQFLRYFTHHSLDESCKQSDTYLWIDAICINQLSAFYKSKQVSFMGEIYENAERVVVWLGKGDDDLYRAMSLMQAREVRMLLDWAHGETIRSLYATRKSSRIE